MHFVLPRCVSFLYLTQVGVFEFCRALDAASDWVAFAWPACAVSGISAGGGCRSPVPALWGLAGARDVFVFTEPCPSPVVCDVYDVFRNVLRSFVFRNVREPSVRVLCS